jgi:hypothetical protein
MATSPIYNWPEPDNTDLVKNGALAIRTLGDAIDTTMGTMVAKTIIDAKGDLIAGTAADTANRLAVGNNGETLVADSSTSTGLRYTENFAAAKNKIINGDFNVNQRNLVTSSGGYGFDRWNYSPSGSTGTYSAQTFTLGTAPVAGYEGKNFARLATTVGNDIARLEQKIESVRTFAGQSVTLSFWAKGTNPTTSGNLAVNLYQNFGTGGSPSATVSLTQQTYVLTANWTRYSFTFNIPSISGKTIGTNNDDSLQIWIGQGSSLSTDAWTLDLWGVQLEAGSVATAFQTSTGTIQGELAACQRYYYRAGVGDSAVYGALSNAGFVQGATTGIGVFALPVKMRTTPSSTIDVSNIAFRLFSGSTVSMTSTTFDVNQSTSNVATVYGTISASTAGTPGFIAKDNNANGYIGFTAEL